MFDDARGQQLLEGFPDPDQQRAVTDRQDYVVHLLECPMWDLLDERFHPLYEVGAIVVRKVCYPVFGGVLNRGVGRLRAFAFNQEDVGTEGLDLVLLSDWSTRGQEDIGRYAGSGGTGRDRGSSVTGGVLNEPRYTISSCRAK